MKTFKLAIDIREKDVHGNSISIQKTQQEIINALSKVWNIFSIGNFENEPEIANLKASNLQLQTRLSDKRNQLHRRNMQIKDLRIAVVKRNKLICTHCYKDVTPEQCMRCVSWDVI